jgi:hypothetical protein
MSRSRMTSVNRPSAPPDLGHHLGEGPDGDLDAQDVTEEPGHAVIRQVLVDGQIGGQGAHPGAVAGRGGGRFGCSGLGLAPARTPSAFHAVLGDEGPHRWELEDLAPLDADDVGIEELRGLRPRRSSRSAMRATSERLRSSSSPMRADCCSFTS